MTIDTTTHAQLLADLYSARDRIWREKWELDAGQHDVEEQIARLEGNPLLAEYHRLGAEWSRTRTPEAAQAEHRALIEYLADSHLRRGAAADGEYADEVEARMEEMIREREALQPTTWSCPRCGHAGWSLFPGQFQNCTGSGCAQSPGATPYDAKRPGAPLSVEAP